MVALLGVLGAVYAVDENHTINVYWLLLVLLGFNFISMFLWLIGINLNIRGLITGVLAGFTGMLSGLLERKSQPGTPADRAWLTCNTAGRIGKWQISKVVHRLWLVYLFGGLTALVLLLIVRQYDFVWGTTLLTGSAFVKLTGFLGTPLKTLGLAVPSADQVLATQIDASRTLTAEYRYLWAQFLLGALLCYGIIPRALLWCWSAVMSGIARRRFTLDYYLPYYIHLRQQLMPATHYNSISNTAAISSVVSETPATQVHALPDTVKWVAVEIGGDVNWPASFVGHNDDLGQVVDRESLARIQQQIKAAQYPEIAIAVRSIRTPDRGIRRAITEVLSVSTQRWLVLLSHKGETVSNSRLTAWYRLAEGCGIPADHVVNMNV